MRCSDGYLNMKIHAEGVQLRRKIMKAEYAKTIGKRGIEKQTDEMVKSI